MLNVVSGPDSVRLLPLRFAATAPPNQTTILKYPVNRDATITSLRVRIYAGPQLALRITPYVMNAREQRRNLVQTPEGGKPYIDGDDDTFPYALSEPVDADAGDVITVEVVNVDTASAYDFAVDVSLDFSNGQYPGVNNRG